MALSDEGLCDRLTVSFAKTVSASLDEGSVLFRQTQAPRFVAGRAVGRTLSLSVLTRLHEVLGGRTEQLPEGRRGAAGVRS